MTSIGKANMLVAVIHGSTKEEETLSRVRVETDEARWFDSMQSSGDGENRGNRMQTAFTYSVLLNELGSFIQFSGEFRY